MFRVSFVDESHGEYNLVHLRIHLPTSVSSYVTNQVQ